MEPKQEKTVKILSRKERFFWGGVGGIVTTLVSALTLAKTTFVGMTFGVFMVWTIRVFAQFCLGGIFVFTDEQENRIGKLIHTGITAPLLAATLLSAIGTSGNHASVPQQQSRLSLAAEFAYAENIEEDTGSPIHIKHYEDQRDLLDTVKQGFGIRPNFNFIIGKETDDLNAALRFIHEQYGELLRKGLLEPRKDLPTIKLSLYAPYKNVLKYTVVLAENTTPDESEALIKLLLENDFKGVEVWNLQCECWPDREKAK